MLAPARLLTLAATLVALAVPASAQAAAAVSVTGSPDPVVGAQMTLTATVTTDSPVYLHVIDEPAATACAPTAGDEAARPGAQRVTSFGQYIFPPGNSQDFTRYITVGGAHTVCAYLVDSFDEFGVPLATGVYGYAPRAPSASLRLAVPRRADLSSKDLSITASGSTEAVGGLEVLAHPGTTPCAGVSADEQERGDSRSLFIELVDVGPYTFTHGTRLENGTWTVCGYLSGSREQPPYAAASAPVEITGSSLAPGGEEEPDIPRGRPTYGGAFGAPPIPISIGPGGEAANGSSGGAAVSGDNRKTRLAAFHSEASNLVRGDSNKATDVFVWHRPRRRSQIYLDKPAGTLERASVGSGGRQANGPSTNPSLDGSITKHPHCVAFQSKASNLAAGDRDKTSDVFVRDLARRKTYLVSRGIGAAATSPSIDGSCSRVAFAAGGQVRVAPVRGGPVRSMGRGSQPDFALDGSAIVWVKGGNVWIDRRGKRSKVGPGNTPRVSDEESGIWGIVFNTRKRLSSKDKNSAQDVYTRVVKRSGGPSRTDLISAPGKGSRSFGKPASNGGITAYGANRGIITFTAGQNAGATLFYRNNNTGNIDNLADTFAGGAGSIYGVATSARANFVAFASSEQLSTYDKHGGADVYFKHLIDGEPY